MSISNKQKQELLKLKEWYTDAIVKLRARRLEIERDYNKKKIALVKQKISDS